MLYPKRVRYACIRIKAGNIPETIKFLENSWKKLVPDFPFVYGFLDDRIDGLYTAEQRMGTVFNCFTLLAIFIACLGLFGLASFMAEQRTKEIGIRKVLGAPVFGIVFMLSREFTKWVLVANIIAWPLAYFAMNRWLQNFAYRINIGISTFLLAAALVFIIALFTVSFQAFKAALLNPVEALRYE
jgi:putative ABC transport system permease protein